MKKSEYAVNTGTSEELDIIKPLWEKLNQLHYEVSPYFKDRFLLMRWETRKKKLIEKAGSMLFQYVMDGREIIGYAITTIDRNDPSIGEIDSVFVEADYRSSGIGRALMEEAVKWLDQHKVATQKLLVGAGNESVMDFYSHYDFFPLHIVLQRKINQ